MRGKLIAATCWVLILACVAVVLVRTIGAKRQQAGGSTRSAQQTLQARYAVGAKATLPLPEDAREALLESFERDLSSPAAKIRAAVMAGELLGWDQATARLEQIKDTEAVRMLQVIRGQGSVDKHLRNQFGWFTDLAASPHDPALRAAVVSAGRRTFITLIAVTTFGLGALVAGLVLLILAAVQRYRGKFKSGMPALPPNTTAYLEAFTIYLLVMVGGGLLIGLLELPRTLALLLMPGAFVVALLWPRLRGQAWLEWRVALGITRGKGLVRECLSGLAGYLATLPLLAFSLIFTLVLNRWMSTDAAHPIMQTLSSADIWTVLLLLFAATVWAPVTEELLFRGAFYGHLRRGLRPVLSALLIGFVFAAIHPQGLAGVPPLMALAFGFAMVREWRGSIIGPVFGHAINNAGATIVILTILR